MRKELVGRKIVRVQHESDIRGTRDRRKIGWTHSTLLCSQGKEFLEPSSVLRGVSCLQEPCLSFVALLCSVLSCQQHRENVASAKLGDGSQSTAVEVVGKLHLTVVGGLWGTFSCPSHFTVFPWRIKRKRLFNWCLNEEAGEMCCKLKQPWKTNWMQALSQSTEEPFFCCKNLFFWSRFCFVLFWGIYLVHDS